MFQQDGTSAHQHATSSLSWSETEMRETRRRLSACVSVYAGRISSTNSDNFEPICHDN